MTGSARLDTIVGGVTRDRRRGAQRAAAISGRDADDARRRWWPSKFTQIAPAFAALVEAAAGDARRAAGGQAAPGRGRAIRTSQAAGGARHVSDVAAFRRIWAPLTAIADAIVTVNSTAAIEAMLLDVPALVVALPNNLTPFVDAGRDGGRGDARALIGPALRGSAV